MDFFTKKTKELFKSGVYLQKFVTCYVYLYYFCKQNYNSKANVIFCNKLKRKNNEQFCYT